MPNIPFEDLLLKRYTHWDLYLHEQQQYLGRCYAALKSGEEVDPFTLPVEIQLDFNVGVINEVRHCFDQLFAPRMYNYANLRNTWRVCHWHIIPRHELTKEFAGFTFEDRRPTKNYTPYLDLPQPGDEVIFKIRDAIREALPAAVR
ncbi:MAG TPA: hypothetical protein VLA04_04350 [Verrucomicrobiae bacterium]|nr:hypothetical protein [Verrucomicrobiae bacterium]